MSYNVILKKNEEKRILCGHHWVYANEVYKIEGEGHNGDLAKVYSSSGQFLGEGFINHLSKILVRILSRSEVEIDKNFFIEKIKRAQNLRSTLDYGNSYRLVFSEADDLPGLIVDRYDDLFCIQIMTLGMDKCKALIIDALVDIFNPRGIYERSDAQIREKEGLKQFKGPIYGDFEPRTTIVENGLKMNVDLENGQKTGYFLDQKENRFSIRRYSKDKEILDCFCNVGGFSINAAMAGAKKVYSCDISELALKEVVENAKLNGVENVINPVCGDVFEVLRNYKKDGKKFDVVVLDPPAFCKTANDVKNAYRGYKDINILGMKVVKNDGFLITASCSQHMTLNLFQKMITEASKESGKIVRVIETRFQSNDHPYLVCEEESAYLKFFILQVSDK